MPKIVINKWNEGMRNDPRAASGAYNCQNFDNFSFEHKLIPLRGTEDTKGAGYHIQNFVYGSDDYVWALGEQASNGRVKLFRQQLPTGAFAAVNNGEGGAGVTVDYPQLFIQYGDYIYGGKGNTGIWKFGNVTTGAYTFTDTAVAIATTWGFRQGLVFSKDGYLYIPYDNYVAQYNGSTWSNTFFTIPSTFVISSVCEYGNYIAVGAKSTIYGGKSRVFLFDISNPTTPYDNIEWGYGDLEILESIGGTLVGLSTTYDALNSFMPRLSMRYYDGASTVMFDEFVSRATTGGGIANQLLLYGYKQKFADRLYFNVKIYRDDVFYDGVMYIKKVGRNIVSSLVETPNNDTALALGDKQYGFLVAGEYTYFAFDTDNCRRTMDGTTPTSVFYPESSIYDTVINPGMAKEHYTRKKSLYVVALKIEACPFSGGYVNLQYKVDGGSWADIPGFAAVDPATTIYIEKNNATGAITQGREFMFRIKTKGVVVTELAYRYDVMSDNIQ